MSLVNVVKIQEYSSMMWVLALQKWSDVMKMAIASRKEKYARMVAILILFQLISILIFPFALHKKERIQVVSILLLVGVLLHIITLSMG